MGVAVERYGTGRQILFIHGAGGSTTLWRYQKEYLSQHMEVILVDLPGHGKSRADAGCTSVDEYRDALLKVMKKERIVGPVIAGHSLGGAIALSFALTHPEQVSGLVLVATGAKLKVFPEILQGILKDKKGTATKIMEFALSKKASALAQRTALKEMMKTRKRVIYGDFYSCAGFDVMARVKEISVPTLILCGRDDFLTPPKYSEFLNREIRGSRLALIEGAGHMIMLEKPEETNRAIESFVGGLDPSR